MSNHISRVAGSNLVTGFISTCLAVILSAAAAADGRPNIVVFLSDDHTLSDSSLYGSTDMVTPNMERIAERGMTFDQAYVASPSCAPSRAALLTGLMPARNGAERNHARPRDQIKKLPAYFHDLGYEVVAFGKVGHYTQTPEYGFDLARHYTYHDDVAVGEAIKWLEARLDDRPLCLFVGTNWPHVPWPEPTSIDAEAIRIPDTHVETPETRHARAMYYQAVRIMDDEFGQVFDAAYRKLGANTLFVHTSDHGAQWPFSKWNLYDDGIRTPMVAVWPGHIAAGVRTDAMVSWVDLLPTLIEAAGGSAPDHLDGRSFLPVLTGERTTHRDQIFTTHSGDGNYNVYPSRSVRDSRFKYILNLHPEFVFASHITKVQRDSPYWPSWVEKAKSSPDAALKVQRYRQRTAEELYDLAADPQETKNLAGDPQWQDSLEQMRSTLMAWMDEQKDERRVYGMPELHRAGKPAPNVLVVFIDDMGWSDLSCFGGQAVSTPNIDQLASEGMRFTNFYVNSPICSPSRTALTTGNYPARHRITSFLAEREANRKRGIVDWLDPSVVTLPRLFADAGYHVGHFGKWHMGGQRDVGEAPLITEYGFDASLTNFEGLGPRVLPLCYGGNGQPPRRHDLGSASLGRGPIEWEDRSVITKRFADRAIEFIDEAAEAGKRFYINVWPDDVHSPFYPPAGQQSEQSKRARYHAVLKTMDEQLGPLFERIRSDPQIRENTMILFASDNGPEPGAGSSTPLRGSKGNLFEGGIRSPLIVWAPGLMEDGVEGTTNSSTIVSSIDLVASLITLAHLSPPENYQCDGEDLLAALLGISDAQRSSPLFWRRPPDRPGPEDSPNPDLAIRDGAWKLLTNVDGSNTQLFNLERDVREEINLVEKNPRIAERLKQRVLEWNQSLPQDAIASTAAVERRTPLISCESLLQEMTDLNALARYPESAYRQLQASSYNRKSVARDQPEQGVDGWFADSDGVGFLRTEVNDGRTEWVIMEHEGPGCLVKFWTPFFYYGLDNRVGPRIRIYLDGEATPTIDCVFIELLTRNEWPDTYGPKPSPQNAFVVPSPLAGFTARAGNLYLPIPFAKQCKITLDDKPFYYIVNYRAYPPGTSVQTYRRDPNAVSASALSAVEQRLLKPPTADDEKVFQFQTAATLHAGESATVEPTNSNAAIRQLEIHLDPDEIRMNPQLLRSTVLKISFDGVQTVWCPIGDFFSSAEQIVPFQTWTRTVTSDGKFICRWVMPYQEKTRVCLENLGSQPVNVNLIAHTSPWEWDPRSMYFFARWRGDEILPGNKFVDWNFIDIRGQGVFVGDSWIVFNPSTGWWGEGDEKIYVDESHARMFPDHFGTGTEDYYGWAGGVVPTKEDQFSHPFLANVRVGSTDAPQTQGFNICTRIRSLDAIPFQERFVFDMEASPGVDQRNPWDLLGYSAVSFFYALPGATSNRPAIPEAARKPIISLEELKRQATRQF